tara:strand:- start:24362 stop:24592 length:231 start_codon:yes stop_codon:yes gene_type:complete
MKFTTTLGALGASSLLFSGAGAIELDITSPGRIALPDVASLANMRSFHQAGREDALRQSATVLHRRSSRRHTWQSA